MLCKVLRFQKRKFLKDQTHKWMWITTTISSETFFITSHSRFSKHVSSTLSFRIADILAPNNHNNFQILDNYFSTLVKHQVPTSKLQLRQVLQHVSYLPHGKRFSPFAIVKLQLKVVSLRNIGRVSAKTFFLKPQNCFRKFGCGRNPSVVEIRHAFIPHSSYRL